MAAEVLRMLEWTCSAVSSVARRRGTGALAGVAVALCCAGPARAADADFGISASGYSQVVPAGDANGDGVDDLALVRNVVDVGGHQHGRVAVVFTDPLGPHDVTLPDGIPMNGYVIETASEVTAVVGIGDTNGDGLDDLGVADSSGVTVVYGAAARTAVDLRQLGARGFAASGAHLGQSNTGPLLTGIGDQNGDGRDDLAMTNGAAAQVVLSPDPREADPRVEVRLITFPSGGAEAAVADAGDQDGDGRHDLALVTARYEHQPAGWSLQYTGWLLSLRGPGDIDLTQAFARGQAARLRPGANNVIHQILGLGDQDGDHRTDLGFLMSYDGWCTAIPTGIRLGDDIDLRAVRTGSPGGFQMCASGPLADAGDQNGDGRDDLAADGVVRFTSAASVVDPTRSDPWNQPGAGFRVGGGGEIHPSSMAVLRDFTGDGRPEILWSGRSTGTPDGSAAMNIVLSAPDPNLQGISTPVSADDNVTFAVRYDARPGAKIPAPSFGVRVELTLTGPSGRVHTWSVEGDASAGTHTTQIVVPADRALGVGLPLVAGDEAGRLYPLEPGKHYTYEIRVVNNRGMLASSGQEDFVYDPPHPYTYTGLPCVELCGDTPIWTGRPAATPAAAAKPIPATQLVPASGPESHGVVRNGTAKADRLNGTNYADVLSGGRGADRLTGKRGNDRLDGGPGRDQINAGAGNDHIDARDGERDVVRCGSGRDTVIADRADSLSGCEHVRRTASPRQLTAQR